MILGFKQKFPWGEPTSFRAKILAGVGYVRYKKDGEFVITSWKEYAEYLGRPDQAELSIYNRNPLWNKVHTLREDKHDRWKAGMSIQMVYRGPKYSILDHFNKGIPELEKCKSTQKIKVWLTGSLGGYQDNGQREQIIRLNAIVDGKRIDDTNQLANNDGFNDIIQFGRWFNEPWEGKIIHWTDFRY